VLVSLCDETQYLGCVEARELLGTGDLAPRGGDILDFAVGHLDEILDACDRDVVDGLLFDLLCCDRPVRVKLVLDVGDSQLMILYVLCLVLVAKESVFVVLASGLEIDALQIGYNSFKDLR